MSAHDIPHWAKLTPAQQAALDAGRRDYENDEPDPILPRYTDPIEQACYLAGREQAAQDEMEYFWTGRY